MASTTVPKSPEMVMKKFAIASVLVTAIASPAFALSFGSAPHAGAGATSVYAEGRYIGRDPDPQVRFDLEREAPSYLGNE
jgi:hypothetical protein